LLYHSIANFEYVFEDNIQVQDPIKLFEAVKHAFTLDMGSAQNTISAGFFINVEIKIAVFLKNKNFARGSRT